MDIIQNLNTVWISLTYNCNNRCRWCYAGSNIRDNPKENIPFNRCNEVIDFLSEMDTKKIILIGGEPTIYPQLEGIISKIKSKNIRVGVISNGRRFKDLQFSEYIKRSGLDYLTVSITHPDSYEHDKITRVSGSFYETIEGIKTATEKGIKVASNTVIAKENKDRLEEMVDLLEGFGLEEMTFNICGVCLSNEANNSQLLGLEKAVKVFERVYLYAKSKDIRARLITPMPLCLFDDDLLPELKRRRIVSGGPCQLMYGRNLVIEPGGDIVPCTHLAHFPLMNLFPKGKILSKKEFIKEYNKRGDLPLKFRESIRRFPSKKCEECYEPCTGGCPLYWTRFDPEKEIKGKKTN